MAYFTVEKYWTITLSFISQTKLEFSMKNWQEKLRSQVFLERLFFEKFEIFTWKYFKPNFEKGIQIGDYLRKNKFEGNFWRMIGGFWNNHGSQKKIETAQEYNCLQFFQNFSNYWWRKGFLSFWMSKNH